MTPPSSGSTPVEAIWMPRETRVWAMVLLGPGDGPHEKDGVGGVI